VSSLAYNSLARFGADGAGLVFGLIAGTITARCLGPSGKGVLSALTFLSGLFMQLSCLGLGDAAIFLVGRRKVSSQEALSVTLTAICISAAIGIVALWLTCAVQFHADLPMIRLAVLASCVGLPITVCSNILSQILNSQERIVSTSVVLFVTSGLTTLATCFFVALVPFAVLGAVLAGLLGSTAGLMLVRLLLAQAGLSLRPRWNARYLVSALRYGAPIQASYLLVVMSARADTMLVYSLAGPAAAGHYSVALTFGALVSMLPFAISYASFPRLAHLEDPDALALTTRLFRCGIAAALLSGVAVLSAAPAAIPLLFGQAYVPAIHASMLLVPGGVFWSGQWLLCRASAARGDLGLIFRSFGVSLTVMCMLDYLLIPRFGILGAAAAATVGPALGLITCFVSYRRLEGHLFRLAGFLPTLRDCRFLAATWRRLIPSGQHGAGATSLLER
jgi:O-antigen/teichoic acid export membrane protein